MEELGLLDDDRVLAFDTWLERKLDGITPGIRRDVAEAVEKTVAAHHYCLKKEPESAAEPSIERTASEQLKQVAEQVHTTRQESSILAIRTKNRFQAVETL